MTYGGSTGQVTIQWPDKKLNQLKDAITRAREKREAIADEHGWDANRTRYLPKSDSGDVNVGVDFRNVERKKAALFYDTPSVSLMADEPMQPTAPSQPPMPGQPPPPPPLTMGTLVSYHQELLNGLLGPRHANVKPVMLKALFDVLCPSGVAVFKVGYETRTTTVQAPVFGLDNQPVVNAVTGQPMTQPMELPIWEHWFIANISPMGLLVPANHKDTDHDLAAWKGYDYCLPASQARRMFQLGDDWKPKGTDAQKPYFDADEEKLYTEDDPPVLCTYVEYKAEYFADPGVEVHPEQLCRITLIDDRVVQHEPHPCQTIDPQTARMTLDSVTTFTVQTLTLRDYTDSAWVASDSTITGALTKELNRFRTVTVQQRDGQKNVVLYDPSKFTSEIVAKIEKGTVGSMIPVKPDALLQGIDGIMAQPTTIQQGRESYLGQDYIERDLEQVMGIGANQHAQGSKTTRTATENVIMQRNSEARFEQERQRVLECYLRLVRIFDTLVLRYCDARNAAIILGPIKGQVWAQHKQALLGGYHYELQIDAAKYLDVEARRRQLIQVYSQVAKDPHVNRVPILKDIAAAFDWDPADVVVDKLPEQGPEPIRVSMTITGEQINPALPNFPLLVKILRQAGYDISPEDVTLAQQQAQQLALTGRNTTTGESANDPVEAMTAMTPIPVAGVGPKPGQKGNPEHPGAMPQMPSLSKHMMDESGKMPGPGVM